ncbi:hypothetical protein FO519_008627, partial [Halicephalobus sp. NKZ332]
MENDSKPGIRVETEFGPIEGFLHDTQGGEVTANIFLGVPFAAPPLGELRFEKPVPPEKWKEVLPTKSFRNSCTPYIKMWIQNPTFSEDCLYLNIMAPHTPSKDHEGYPVLVYIHGGGFCFGDVVKAGFDKITRNFASKGLVVVTVPYRLGVYGFFTTGTKDAEGNLGLWDQTMALKFVKNNIQKFGGDPNNITLWGQSAGAAAVSALALSPHSRDLFHKVYQSSGSIFNSWGSGNPSIRCSFALAKALGCDSKDPVKVKAFMKEAKWEDILEISSTKFVTELTADVGDEKYLIFGPRMDDDFFDGKTLDELLHEASPKTTLMGLMSQEAGPFVTLPMSKEKIKDFSIKDFEEKIESSFCPRSQVGDELEPMKEDLVKFYTSGAEGPVELLQKIADLASDFMFFQGVLHDAELKRKNDWKVYFYIWDYVNEFYLKLSPTKGTPHSYELPLFFEQKGFIPFPETEDDRKVVKSFAEILSNFCKHGNPATKSIEFPEYDLNDRKTLRFNLETEIRKDPIKERRVFWDEFAKKYNFNPVRGRTHEQLKNRIS